MLPGGSPGPNAVAMWGTLLAVAVFALAASALMLWFLFYAVSVVG